MTAAPHAGERAELRALLAELYPGDVALGLLELCGPRCEIHHGAACTAPGKRPLAAGWTAEAAARWADPDADADRWRARMADHLARGGNIGWCPPPGALAIDSDTPAALTYVDSALPDAPMQATGRGGHHVARVPADLVLRARTAVEIAPGVRVDLRPALAAQIVVAPSIHASGTPYTWQRSLPADMADLPEIPAALLARLRELAEEPERERTKYDPTGAGADTDWIEQVLAADADIRRRFGRDAAGLGDTSPSGVDLSLASLAVHRGLDGEQAEALVRASRARAGLPRKGASYYRATIGRALSSAQASGAEREARVASDGPGHHVDDDRSASPCEDVANAHRLAQHHGAELRWCASRGWLAWTGTVWEASETRALAIASRLGRIVHTEAAELAARAASATSESDRERMAQAAEALMRWARASEAAKRVRAALDLARPALEIRDDALDADPYALGCRNGVVDLRTGTLRAHRAEDYLTRCTGVAYDPEARSELWARVLAEALPEESVCDYLRRCAGYTALGITGEDVLLLVHGPTRTSKGTVQGAIAAALGTYAMTAGLETFAVRRHADGSRARPELIRLRGARMVSVYETGRALRLDAPLVKSLAGSDAITARALYREEVEFRPACTLWLATNHRPLVDDDDDALWERMREIPFGVHVPPERRDPGVRARLADPADGGPAVLAWIVQGALDYRREGLGQPEAVATATTDYRSAMDPLGDYLAECTVLDPRAWVATGGLREDYERWCRERGDRPLPATRWGESLRRHGCAPRKVGERRGWQGIGLRADTREET